MLRSTCSVDSTISTYESGSNDETRQQANPFASTLKSLEYSVAKDADANCVKIDLANLSSAEDFPFPLMPTWRVVHGQHFFGLPSSPSINRYLVGCPPLKLLSVLGLTLLHVYLARGL